MRIAICDDQPTQVQLMKHYVDNWAKAKQIEAGCFGFSSAEEYLLNSEEQQFDLLFLDIQMGSMNGIELARSLRRHNERLAIVFVTGLREHVFEGFEVQALHYLVKPIKESDCHKCLDLALARLEEGHERMLLINHEGEMHKLPTGGIIYIEAMAHYVQFLTKDGTYRSKMNISNLEEELADAGFYRCHRSYLVNMKYVARIGQTDVILDDGQSIPVSRQKRDGLNQAFINYYKGRI